MSAPRLKKLAPEEMTADQKRVYESIAGGPRGGVRGPFNALLRSPELADRAQKLGEYLRFSSSLPAPLNELAILVTARYWSAQYEWHAHAQHAAKAGVEAATISALAQGKRPLGMKPEEIIVYNFCKELHEEKEVGDDTYKAALERFGERGVVDLVGVCGYYTLVSMVLNVERAPLPEGVAPPIAPLK